jgi:hypothetical protein
MILDGDKWPAIYHRICVIGAKTDDDFKREAAFLKDISDFFSIFQEKFDILRQKQKELCRDRNIVADIAIEINISKKEVILFKLYKYININVHLFCEISRILQHNFPDFILIVPALKGYQLAEEINQHLGNVKLDCLYLKGDTDEKFVESKYLNSASFETILKDTKKHYSEQGGLEKAKCGSDISLFFEDKEGDGEKEVLWMKIRAPLVNPI